MPRQHSSLPAYSAGKRYITNHGISMVQRCRNVWGRRSPEPRADIADEGIPVVTKLVDEAETKPDRIGEIDPGHAPRVGRALVDAVGGEREWCVRKAVCAPAAESGRIATTLRRVLGLEVLRHQSKRFARQPGFKRTAAAIAEKDVVALLDRRRRQPGSAEHKNPDRDNGGAPRLQSRRHAAPDDEHGRDDEQPVAKEVVDRKPEGRDHQQQCCELRPGLMRITGRRGHDVGGRVQCSGLALADGIARNRGCRMDALDYPRKSFDRRIRT